MYLVIDMVKKYYLHSNFVFIENCVHPKKKKECEGTFKKKVLLTPKDKYNLRLFHNVFIFKKNIVIEKRIFNMVKTTKKCSSGEFILNESILDFIDSIWFVLYD
ncbi:hypothetical protein H311_03291 [Anncaliia algerae PRA109]|nr:hypothetical protein H311_03291 [Anncaliia algerae PRA109]